MASPAEAITRHYGGDWHGSYGTFPAPGHSKADRGMSVKDGEAGDVLINSFNGADPLAVKDECRRLGLLPERQRSRRREVSDQRVEQRVTGAFEYADVDGAVLYRTVRLEPGRDGRTKDFRAERPDGKGGWLPGLPKDAPRVLYRLPDVAMTEHGVEPILFVEGERKADKLAEMGFVATSIAFGCKGWRDEYAEPLKGHRVVILPDNDEEGRTFAQLVRVRLNAAGAEAAILDLPGLPAKGDIMDWRGDTAELRRLVDAAPTADEAPEPAPDSGAQKTLGDLPLPVELFGSIVPELQQRWLIKGTLLSGSSCVIFGLPGCGKSFLALDQALHIAAGLDWFGRRTRQGSVVYIAAEGQAGLRLRIDAWKQAHGYSGRELPFALIPTAVDLLDPAADMAKLRTVLAFLAETWGGIDYLIIDTLAATFGGGDETGSDMATYVANVASLCAPHRCARAIVTHAPLAADAKRPRGHGSLWGAADTVLHVSGDRDAPARRINVIKQKDADPGPDILFALRPLEIGVDDEMDPVTSCVVEPSDLDVVAVQKAGRKLTPKEKIVVALLERVMAEHGRLPPPEIPDKVLNRASIGKVVEMSAWRSAAMSALHSPDTKADTARTTFNRARERLQAAEILGIWEEWAWLI